MTPQMKTGSTKTVAKMLRTIRLDKSDTFVFARAAEPGEWAITGGFMFWDRDPARLEGKTRAAFRSGFLGLGSFGWCTLVEVAEISAETLETITTALARMLVDQHGAPDIEAARAAAAEEIAFAASLAEHPPGTVIALQRAVEDDGTVRERFRTIKTVLEPGGNSFAQGCVLPIGVEQEAREPGAVQGEEVDFLGLMRAADSAEPSGFRPKVRS